MLYLNTSPHCCTLNFFFFKSPSQYCEILSKQIKKKTYSVISLQILDNQEVQATMILPRILQVNMCPRTCAP